MNARISKLILPTYGWFSRTRSHILPETICGCLHTCTRLYVLLLELYVYMYASKYGPVIRIFILFIGEAIYCLHTCNVYGAWIGNLYKLPWSLVLTSAIVGSRSVDRGFRTDVYVTVKCTYLIYLRGGKAVLLYYAIGTCVAASLPRERMCSSFFYRVFWPSLEKGDGLTALPSNHL